MPPEKHSRPNQIFTHHMVYDTEPSVAVRNCDVAVSGRGVREGEAEGEREQEVVEGVIGACSDFSEPQRPLVARRERQFYTQEDYFRHVSPTNSVILVILNKIEKESRTPVLESQGVLESLNRIE